MNLTSFEKMLEQNDSTDIALSLIDPFPGHPFRVQEDAEMEELVESIREHGVLVPVILRRHGAGRYQIVAGHRRCFASRKLQKETVPAVVKDLSEEEAVIWMVDSNIQRTDILPSEKAKAYRMKMDALSKQGYRTDLLPEDGASRQLVGRWKKESAEQVGTQNGDSGRQVQRYLRLNHLIPDLLDRVDQKSLAFLAGVELSYLTEESQRALSEYLMENAGKVSLKQARHLKEQEQQEKQGTLTREAITSLFKSGKTSAGIPEKNRGSDRARAAGKDLYKKYFPSGYSAKERDRVICSLLEKWKKGEITV